MALTVARIDNAKPEAKNRKLHDTDGLLLLVTPAGGKWWRFKYRFAGKEQQLSLGTYPDVSLAGARVARNDARKLVAAGSHPIGKTRRPAGRRCFPPTAQPLRAWGNSGGN